MLFNLNKPLRLAFLAEKPALIVYASGVPIWRRTPVLTEYTVDQTIFFPDWARFIDFVGVGGGTSGQTGNGGNGVAGRGGNPGQWIGVTIERGVDIPWTAKQAVLTIGKGGAQAPDNDFAAANPGSASGISITGYAGIIAPGGSGTRPEVQQAGKAAPNFTYNSNVYTGGQGGNQDHPTGYRPGGAGAGGDGGIFGNRTRGHAGGDGTIWTYMRSF
uniref:Glycine-rich domain-containing protein n=1 Tax=Gordonia phage Petito TaxID=3158876 RepID=A0AAU8GQ50_9CAUD